MAKATRRLDDRQLAGSQASGNTTAATLDRDRVAQRAYEIYLARGCGEGQELDDWLCAERELSGDDEADEPSRSER